ncbi:hypothetical protein C1J05_06145 [Sulfitobacter sp. JL08]|uniref:hypothetical protein n=1 Tax=Sulfitobacter sp. JL08 TaxID=2070369 RepID=UPI000E0A60E9|nr:hypothetical protein [Sulfitobacter sp. JL08]AXI54126.1 hypothetical protein C1J05_06145 [Sulfitobacter sp. JL08]
MKYILFTVFAAATTGLTSEAHASTYEYTGLPLTNIVNDPDIDVGYSFSDYLSGSFTMANPLDETSGLTDISSAITSYSFSVGESSFTSSDSDVLTFSVGTAGGNIDEWEIYLESTLPFGVSPNIPNTSSTQNYLYSSSAPLGGVPQDEVYFYTYDEISGEEAETQANVLQSGNWALAQSVPEVSSAGSFAALGTLLTLMAFLWERRRVAV